MAALRHARARVAARRRPLLRAAARAAGAGRSAAPMNRRTALVLLSAVALLIAAGAWRWHTAPVPGQGAVTIAGGDAGGLPRADADAEGFDAKAFQAAAGLARPPPTGGRLVTRPGPLVVGRYG